MKYTRMSLFYLAGYLSFGGSGFFLFPRQTLTLFLSNGDYPDLMVRMIGGFMLALAIIVVQLIRLHVEIMYGTTLMVRAFLLSSIVVFYFVYWDPMLLVLCSIVGLGFALTLTAFLAERTAKGAPAHEHPNS